MTTYPGEAALTAYLQGGDGPAPRLHIKICEADPAPYIRVGDVHLDDQDTWPAGTGVAAGVLPRHTGPVVVALPAPAGDRVGAAGLLPDAICAAEAATGALSRRYGTGIIRDGMAETVIGLLVAHGWRPPEPTATPGAPDTGEARQAPAAPDFETWARGGAVRRPDIPYSDLRFYASRVGMLPDPGGGEATGRGA